MQGGNIAFPPSSKPRGLLLPKGWREQRYSKDETNHLNAMFNRPSDEASGNILARGISQSFSLVIIINIKI